MTTYITNYHANYTISGANSQTATMTSASADTSYACANHLKTSGKWYWEIQVDDNVAFQCIGVAKAGYSTSVRPGFNDYSWGAYRYSTTAVRRYHNGSYSTLSGKDLCTSSGDVVGVALDVGAGKLWFAKNGTWLEGDPAAGTGATFEDADIAANGVMPNNCGRNNGDVQTVRFAASEQSYSPPSGFYPIGGDLIPVFADLLQYWGAGPIQEYLEEKWGLQGDPAQGYLAQDWGITVEVAASISQMWGLKLMAALSQRWDDAPTVQAGLWQWYGDCAELQSWLSQRYGDALDLRGALDQGWHIYSPLQAILSGRYAITDTEVQGVLEQAWDLHANDAVRATLSQPWLIAAASSLVAAASATVTVAGAAVDPYHVNVETSEDQYPITGELHFSQMAPWLPIADGDPVAVSVDGTDYLMIVTGKRRSRRLGQSAYIVECASEAVLMDEPWALPLLTSYDSVLASTLAQSLATPYGLTVDWQIVDDYVYDLYANDETPLALLRKMAGEWGGVVQCQPDGTILVRRRYPVSVPGAAGDTWNTVSPAATLTDQDNFFSADETVEHRPGYNRYLIGNQDTATAGARLEEETISASRKLLRAYITPWQDSGLYTLATSKTGVALQPLAVPAADYLVADELVEFVNGGGRTARPVFALGDYQWQDTQLGALTFSEDGELTAEVAGNSLLLVTYSTRFLLWQADCPQIADVQFILERADE